MTRVESLQRNVQGAPEAVRVASPAWTDGAAIPRKYTCDGANVSPPLAFDGVPREAATVAIVMDDPDAPNGTFTHWTAWNLPPDVEHLEEGADVTGIGGRLGRNDFGRVAYGGPCPPSGTHRYYVKIYALDAELALDTGAAAEDLYLAMEDHVLAWGTLLGTYARD